MKNNIKKFVSGALITTILIAGLPVNFYKNQFKNIFENRAEASTDNTYTIGNSTYHYKILEDGTVEITDYEGTDTKIKIPEEIDGKKVTSIGDFAFYDCSSLKQIEIPVGVTSIGGSAFHDCSSLEQIEIPVGVTSIRGAAFYGCSSLKQIEIPEGVTSIGDFAFYECSSLEQIEISVGVTSIGGSAFDECSSLEQIEIPASVTSIRGAAFYGCSSLTAINVDKNNRIYSSIDGVLFNKDCSEIIKYPEGKENNIYKIPEGVISIEYSAFERCGSLAQIEIPVGVTSIGNYAFYGCSSLEQIEIPSSVIEIGYDAFYDCDLLTIYGYSGSYAEEYANQQGIPFISIINLKSDDNIVLEYPENTMEADISLNTKLLIDEDEEYKNIILENKLVDTSINPLDVEFTAYDINLLDSNNNKVQPNGYVTVKIPCPEGYVGENCKVYRVNNNGGFTDMEVIYEEGMLVFKTNHFSTYIITETSLITTPDSLLGDANSDGEVDSLDAVLMKKYLAGYSDLEIDEAACDVDGDGEVTSIDTVLLLKYLAGYDVELV